MAQGDAGRTISMSRSGRFVALRRPGGLDLVDALGAQPRHGLDQEVDDFACVGAALWVLAGGRIDRYGFEGLRPIEPAVELGAGAAGLRRSAGTAASTALVTGDAPRLVHAAYDQVTIDAIDGPAAGGLWPLAGRRVLVAGDDLRVIEVGKGEVARMPRPDAGAVRGAVSLFGGRAIALLVEGERQPSFVVLRPTGGLVHKVAVPAATHWAIAEQRGVALVAHGDRRLIAVDLRYGRIQAEGEAPIDIDVLAVDADGQYAAIAGAPEHDGATPPVVHVPLTEILVAAGAPRDDRDDDDRARPRRGRVARDGLSLVTAEPAAAPAADAADAPPPPADLDTPAPAPVVVPDLLPRALGELPAPLRVAAPPDIRRYPSPREHVDGLLDLVAAQAARAIAEGWHSGRLSVPAEDGHPFEREVLAILGRAGTYAPDQLGDAHDRLARLGQQVSSRAAATLASGTALPFVELSRQMGLSATAAQVLMVVAAPQIRGEVARLYGVLANDENRPMVDRYLVELIVAGDRADLRAEVAAELASGAPLLRFGLIRQDGAASLFAALSVDPVLIDRIRGREAAPAGGVTTLRTATRALGELRVPAEVARDLVLALAQPRPAERAIRVVLRGRRGSGRHSLVAALAARVGRQVAAIDAGRLPRAGKVLAAGLAVELTRALLRNAVPVVSGLENVEAGDPEGQDAIQQVLRGHPGPVVIRATPEGALPLEPGYVSFTLPALAETERASCWRDVTARLGLPCADVDGLAARFRVGPGVIEQIAGEAAARRAQLGATEGADEGADAGPLIEEVARQHIAMRLGHIANHVTRLARWEQVALPEDLLDSLREFIGRIRHRRTVYEAWGFDAKMSTSRGLSALFYGPPGTGKSMVAGLIARELGLELYRVDLARIVSKWIGETEKNLAEVFDAAEDGQVVVLFDEADSLFAKRTEVKSSVDRYANLEVNYLLQRLDSFEGICILTTNLEGSIDQAFKRRMSLRLQFPFPDEDMRVRLWASHLPPETPTAGDFDFVELARRFPLSGGYIRNSTLRAAFLAAQEERPLSQDHLVRAIQLEYRELGKLSTTGRME
jgi:ATPase family associated with various cellular activities (AAA)/Winged helix domain, variant